MTLYNYQSAEKIINQYIERGGEAKQLDEGTLCIGDWICYGDGLKTCIIKEVYINDWSSGQSIRFYNKTPKKYINLLN